MTSLTIKDFDNAMNLGATNKGAVSKMVKAWEAKNDQRVKRAAGLGLMAVSLAACGGEDDTPFSQTDIDAATAPLNTQISTVTANLTTMTGLRDGLATQLAVIDAKIVAAGHTNVDALVAQRDVLVTDLAAANTSIATLTTNLTTMTAARDALQTSLTATQADLSALVAELTAAGFTDLTDLINAYVALITPVSMALTSLADTPSMTAGNDAITGTSTTYTADDIIVDNSTTDSDTIVVTASGDITATPIVVNVETITFNLSAVAAAGGDGASTFDVDVADIAGADTLAFAVVSTGSAVSRLAVDNMATNTVVSTTSDFTTITVNAVDNADYTVNARASSATTAISFVDAGATADDVTVTSTGALTVTSTVLDGDLTLSAAGDIIVTESDESASVTATSSAGSITITTADAAETLTLTAADEVVVTGATGAETVTVSAAGTGVTGSGTTASTISATAATTLNISGNGAALVANAAGSAALTSIIVTGSQDVTVEVSGASLTAANSLAFTDSSSGTSVLEINADGAGITMDLIDVSADVISVDVALHAADILSVATGATIRIDADNANGVEINGAYATRTTNVLNLQVGDDATDGAANDIAGTLEGDNFATVNIVLNDTDSTAGGVDLTTIDFATATVNISGVSDVDINSATAGSINASAATGNIAIDLVGAATVANVTTGSGDDTVTQTTADLTTGGYTISTGAGADSIVLLAAADSTVNGGDGVDTVTMDGDYSARTISLSNVEIVELDDGSNLKGSVVNGGTFVIRDTGDTDAAATITVDTATVDMSGISVDSTTFASFTITGTTYGAFTGLTVTGTSVVDNITGGANGDTLTGGDGADVVAGAAGADVIYGDDGADSLTGGAGSDTVYGGDGADSLFGDNDGTKEVQTITVATTADANDVLTVTVLGKAVTVTVTAAQTVTQIATNIAAAIEADTELAGLVTATSALGVVTATFNIDGNVAAITATEAGANATTYTVAEGTAGVAGSDGNDTIYAGDGADLIYGSGGTDVIDLSGDETSVQDIVFFNDANDGFTTINGFVVNKDSLSFEAMVDITGTANDVAADAAEIDPTAGQIYIFANGADGTGSGTESVIADYSDLVDVAAFIEAAFTAAVTEDFVVMINDLAGDDVHIYLVNNDGAAAAIASTDLDYIGVLSDIGSTPLNSGEIL